MSDQFFVTAGSIVGREHVRLHRNNQDGVALYRTPELIVAAVTDGCSQGRHSEVGARLGATWLAEWIPVYLQSEKDEKGFVDAVTGGLSDYLAQLGHGLRPCPDAWSETVRDYLLFTFLCSVITPARTLVFGLGDGVFSVNSSMTCLDSGPENAPAYLAYRMLSRADLDCAAEVPEPVIHYLGPTDTVESIILATDGFLDLLKPPLNPAAHSGLGPGIEEFERDPRLLRNPSLLHKRLVVLGERHRRLSDDTTMVLIRRRMEA